MLKLTSQKATNHSPEDALPYQLSLIFFPMNPQTATATLMNELKSMPGEKLATLWATFDQLEVALVPALIDLAGRDAEFAGFVAESVRIMRFSSDLASTPKQALYEETKRRFLLSVASFREQWPGQQRRVV
jgi:hypothetical protein